MLRRSNPSYINSEFAAGNPTCREYILPYGQNALSSPKINIMKKSLPLLFSAMLFATSCSNMLEKQLDIYEDATNELESIDDFQALMNEVLDTGSEISRLVAKDTEEDKEERKEDYGTDYEMMLDSVETMRNRYLTNADRLFLGYTYNFVERRILLYQMAADRYCKAESIEELNTFKEIIDRYSRLSFIESQRACDPPASIRKEYETKKDLAESCFDVAKKRILDEE